MDMPFNVPTDALGINFRRLLLLPQESVMSINHQSYILDGSNRNGDFLLQDPRYTQNVVAIFPRCDDEDGSV